jgi:hypothetical protein
MWVGYNWQESWLTTASKNAGGRQQAKMHADSSNQKCRQAAAGTNLCRKVAAVMSRQEGHQQTRMQKGKWQADDKQEHSRRAGRYFLKSRKKCTILNGDLEAQNESKVQNQ